MKSDVKVKAEKGAEWVKSGVEIDVCKLALSHGDVTPAMSVNKKACGRRNSPHQVLNIIIAIGWPGSA